MTSGFNRDSISRARLFVEMARQCDLNHRDEHEAFLDAAIVFGRSALHRLHSTYKQQPAWTLWWGTMATDPSVRFLKRHRNFALHAGPTPVGQVASTAGGQPLALDHYYFERQSVPAVDTLAQHIDRIEEIVRDAEGQFSSQAPGRA